ncbi:hypothetical protein B0H13DRAFT_2565702 [Mycena leptocephala]|nr:hypothetical protein B0H13DRAFT_2565702 [Mycena leptocephala]
MSPSSPPHKLLEYTAMAANALHDVATASQIPFLGRVCTLTLTIIPMVQSTRIQRERCFRIMEEIHHSLCALTSLSIHSDNIHAPRMLDQIAQYAGTLQKLDSCLRSQRELGTIRRLFKQGEITAQLDTCEAELRERFDTFTTEQGVGLATALVELNIDTETRHQELLEMIASQSGSFDDLSSIGRSSSNVSSVSFSNLPATPKIFHGREAELKELIDSLLGQSGPRIAILGPGGMGKTTLATVALHHPKVAQRYPTCHFVSCDSARTCGALVATLASNCALEASRGLERVVVHHLSSGPPCLLILDNFETPWEPAECRAEVEEFLSKLADITHMALVITMRGAERPGKVGWTRPFLRPLMPLTPDAARKTFIDIADEVHDNSEVDRLLYITDNVPLAIQLVAAIAATEGCQTALERWERERTAILSAGHDKRSNLEISIVLSLSSPRLLASPHAVELLSLMSLLSDGITDLDLVQCKIGIPDIAHCKTTLIRTSLAYNDHAGRFKVLAPIRDYINLARPPSLELVRPLRKYLIELLKLYVAWWHASTFAIDLVPRLVSNLGNLHNVLLQGLDSDQTDLRESVLGILLLNDLNGTMNRGLSPLMLRLPEILSAMDDHELHGRFTTEAFESGRFYTLPNPELAIDKATEHFRLVEDHDAEARLYCAIASYYSECAGDVKKAERFFSLALSAASQDRAKVRPLGNLGLMEWGRGNYSRALQLAQETYKIARASGNLGAELVGIRVQALCYSAQGDFRRCMKCLEEGKGLIFRAGLQGGQMENMLMTIEADLYQLKTEYSNGRRIQEAMLCSTSAVLSSIPQASVRLNIAFLDIVTGASIDVVSRNLDAATTVFGTAQYQRGLCYCDYCHAELLFREGDATWARVEYIRIFAAARDNDKVLACYCLARLADPSNPVHEDMECERWAIVFLAYALRPQARSRLMVHQALRRLGDVLVGQGADDAALSVLTVALEGFTQMDVHQSRAECMRTIGDVYVGAETWQGREMWDAAQPLFERSEQKKKSQGCRKLRTLSVAQKLDEIPC